jgi:hypothetical protein
LKTIPEGILVVLKVDKRTILFYKSLKAKRYKGLPPIADKKMLSFKKEKLI